MDLFRAVGRWTRNGRRTRETLRSFGTRHPHILSDYMVVLGFLAKEGADLPAHTHQRAVSGSRGLQPAWKLPPGDF